MKDRNVLRDLIREGKPTIGTHLFTQWPGMVEIVGHSGTMDYIEFSGQYAPYDLFSLENFGRAIDMFDHLTAMMKLDQEPRTYLAERAVGSGIQNLLFAEIRDLDDAKEAIAAIKPTDPKYGGRVGAASTRDTGYVGVGLTLEEYARRRAEGVLALMIEKKTAVEQLEEILGTGQIDMVQFGASDYSMSIGLTGQYTHPKVKEAERYTIETCIKMGVRPRVELSRWQDAQPYIDMGVIDFCIGSDVGSFYDYCNRQGEGIAKAVGR